MPDVCALWSHLQPSARAVFLTSTARLGGSLLGADASPMLDHVVLLYRVVGGENATDAELSGRCHRVARPRSVGGRPAATRPAMRKPRSCFLSAGYLRDDDRAKRLCDCVERERDLHHRMRGWGTRSCGPLLRSQAIRERDSMTQRRTSVDGAVEDIRKLLGFWRTADCSRRERTHRGLVGESRLVRFVDRVGRVDFEPQALLETEPTVAVLLHQAATLPYTGRELEDFNLQSLDIGHGNRRTCTDTLECVAGAR